MKTTDALRVFTTASSCEKHWDLQNRAKYNDKGVSRAIPPAETVRRVRQLMPNIGVTRVSEVTYLDRVGIPNFMTVRPRDSDQGISYYNGKGIDKASALAGAMMEAVERFSGERCDLPVLFANFRQVMRLAPSIDPRQLIVPLSRGFDARQPIEWVLGFDLLARSPTFVPLNAVICPYRPGRGPAFWYASTNGLASGNCLEEALCHALCEVIERDVLALAFATLELAPAIDSLLATAHTPDTHPARNLDRFHRIALDSLPPRARQLIEKLHRAGLKVYLRNITATGDIASFDCTIVELQPDGRHFVHGGSGTHPDARLAVVRAITEAAQSRVACIQGGREDLPEILRPRTAFDPEALYGSGPVRPYSSVPSQEHSSIDRDVKYLLDRLARAGFRQVVVVDMTRADIGVPVVRVVVPNAESWTVFHMHTGRGVFGGRIARLLAGAPA